MYYFFSGRLVKQQAWLLMVVVIMEILPNSAFKMIYVGGAVYFHKQSCYDTL